MVTAKRVAIYARRSRPGEDDGSIREQIEVCQRWVLDRSHVLATIYTEKKSGGTAQKRPEFLRLIADAQKTPRPFDLIVTLDLSRFGRFPPREAGHYKHLLDRAGVEVVHVLEEAQLSGPSGQIVESVLQDSANQVLKTGAVKALLGQSSAIKAGFWAGGSCPYGYRLVRNPDWRGRGARNTRIEIDEPKAEIVRRIFGLYVGGLGHLAIAKVLNEEGIPSPKSGTEWCRTTVREILANPTFKGDLTRGVPRVGRSRNRHGDYYRTAKHGYVRAGEEGDTELGVVKTGAVPAIVSSSLWDKADRVRRDRTREHRTGGVPTLLLKVGRCGACSGPLATMGHTGREGRYSYYSCGCRRRHGATTRREECGRINVRQDRLDEAVLREVRKVVSQLDEERIRERIMAAFPKQAGARLGELEERRKRLAGRRDALLFGDHAHTDEFVRDGVAKLSAEANRLDREIEAAKATQLQESSAEERVQEVLEAVKRLEAPDTPEGRAALREVMRAFVAELTVGPAPRGSPKPVRLVVYTIPPAFRASFPATRRSTVTVCRRVRRSRTCDRLSPDNTWPVVFVSRGTRLMNTSG